ncbi:Glycosyl transferase family 8 [Musa troglodytarum]|uniref:Hexosyltransferase n=1 Tax=Musa troglodytarum TaxID=320322 RepID=A0A9E7G5P1_9LILI|nr:Glycosyl transferase family 8 [Musa troglodytarum]
MWQMKPSCIASLILTKGFISASSTATDSVHRDDAGRRRPQRFKVLTVDKYKVLFSERGSGCKLELLKLALFILVFCMGLRLAFSPTIHKEQQLLPSVSRYSFRRSEACFDDSSTFDSKLKTRRSRLADAARIRQTTLSDPRYVSNLDADWGRLSDIVKDISTKEGDLNVGLLNFNFSEVRSWQQTLPHAKLSSVHLNSVDTSITWEVLYPEWIDEEEEYEVPACPSLPRPQVKKRSGFDLVAVKLPCDRSGSWSRDVARLHLQLAAAQLAAASQVHVLLVTECLPIPNLFTCKDLVGHGGNLWLYKPDSTVLEEKLRLPIGSCKLAIPFEAKVRSYTEAGRREAYATILHSAERYVCGAIALARSIRSSGSARDLVILVDGTISEHDRSGLEAAGWKVRTMERIRNPKAKRDAYNEWNYSKFRLWQLTEYDKVVFLDADLLVLRNIDFLFALPEITAVGNNAALFNSGVMVVEPSNCTFQLLMDHIDEITSYNGGDQGYLNEIFTWWHRVPKSLNFLKHFWAGDAERRREKKNRLLGADPPVLYVVHYLGLKPWLCFRDYDCNWDLSTYWGFASDAAHETWWKVHDTLTEKLKAFCLLPTKTKAYLEYNRRQAQKASYPDGHWRKNITDPRLHVCAEKFCSWESMLVHWGEKSSSNDRHTNANPPAALPSS